MKNIKLIMLLVTFLGISNCLYAQKIVGQKEKYTGDPITVDEKDNKHYFSYDGKLAGYYTKTKYDENTKDSKPKVNKYVVEQSAFGSTKYKKARVPEKTELGFNGSFFSPEGQYLGDIDYENFGMNFKFKNPYEVIFNKGIKIKPMHEELIVTGKIKM